MVISCSLGRLFQVRLLLPLIQVKIRCKAFTWTVVEVVLWVKTEPRIVASAQILYAHRLRDRVILTSHMVGHEVDNYLQACIMGTLNQLFKLLHALLYIDGQVWVNVVVVGDGIWRTCLTFHHSGMLAWNAKLAIVGLSSMADNSGIPHMAYSHLGYVLQHFWRKVCQFSTTVFGNRAVNLAGNVTIAEQTREYLINNYLIHNSYTLGVCK